MDYHELKDYLKNKMRMSHIYQPIMIKELLASDNPVSIHQIARRFLEQDPSQIEYYEHITRNMPGPVLSRRGVVQKVGNSYSLKLGEDSLTNEQREELISLCDKRMNEYIQRRGEKIWQHRRISSKAIRGSIKFEVLKRAGSRCQLCGIRGKERSLEVDHIIPRKLHGPNTIDNYQALCYKCNSSKRDTDSTDFRDWKNIYDKRQVNCLFCYPEKSRVLVEVELAYVFRDKFPVSKGHILIIPKRHVSSFFELFTPEVNSCIRLLNEAKRRIEKEDSTVAGFNIGINVNEAAGQSVMHCHLHLLPRRFGDVPNPRGGVRNIMPGKGNY